MGKKATGGIRFWVAFALCLLFPLGGMAQGLLMADPLEGTALYPAGATEEQAAYRFYYQYPQFSGEEAAQAINAYYQSAQEGLVQYVLPEAVEEAQALWGQGAPTFYTEVTYQVTATTNEYVSVLVSTRQFRGYDESETLTANVFALDGLYMGQPVTLSQVMGLEQEDGAATGAASQLVYHLVWQIIQQEQAGLQRDYFEGLTQEGLVAAFSPETDFYLDGDENLVFFIQPGMVAGEVEGVVTYPFSMAEVLSAARE